MTNYKLSYFDGRGRAEFVRLIFVASDTKFEDKRIDYEKEWSGVKSDYPLGQLPTLNTEGTTLVQSLAIARYIARECNLAGPDNLRQAQADAIVDCFTELINIYYNVIFAIEDEAEKAKAYEAFMADQGVKVATNVEKLINLYGSNGFSVGQSLTWADLYIFEIFSLIYDKQGDLIAKFPRISAVRETVAKNAKVAEHVKNRAVTPF
jgi:glutathione S-transferase